jgi:hypothetical protein
MQFAMLKGKNLVLVLGECYGGKNLGSLFREGDDKVITKKMNRCFPGRFI